MDENVNGWMDGWMDKNVKFVSKEINPPNIPQARPIQNFWVFLAQKVYKGDCESKTEQQLTRRIESQMKNLILVESLLERVMSKLKSIGDNGIYTLFK